MNSGCDKPALQSWENTKRENTERNSGCKWGQRSEVKFHHGGQFGVRTRNGQLSALFLERRPPGWPDGSPHSLQELRVGAPPAAPSFSSFSSFSTFSTFSSLLLLVQRRRSSAASGMPTHSPSFISFRECRARQESPACPDPKVSR